MKFGFTPLALRELDDILDYIAKRAPAGAKRVQARFHRVFELIAQNPDIGRRTRMRDCVGSRPRPIRT